MKVVQINLQTQFGGGEVYTAFLCRALAALGVSTRLICHRQARFWADLGLPADTELVPVASGAEIAAVLPEALQWIVTHGAAPAGMDLDVPHLVTAIAHMPVQGRNPAQMRGFDKVFAVSRYVQDGLTAAGIDAWSEPLYGVADLRGRAAATALRQRSRYDWDRRKGRDRLLGWLEPLVEPLRARPLLVRRAGLTLGIVSRLTPIKQFPLLFEQLVPVLLHHPDVNLEIFGSGGYASVRDLARVLAPLGARVRWWGQQADVAACYGAIDWLLTGLPEKEALGLNVIEAQASGTPVLAVRAAPFTETVAEGRSGYFYRDPRADDGAEFAALLARLPALPRLDPRLATAHLDRFSEHALVERLRPVVAWAERALATA